MPPLRGEVYTTLGPLPPGQSMKHAVVVLSPNSLISQHGRNLFVNVAIIRSAIDHRGNPVRGVPVHSVRITQADLPYLVNDSFVETHQLFALPLDDFQKMKRVDRLSQQALDRVLLGAQYLFK